MFAFARCASDVYTNGAEQRTDRWWAIVLRHHRRMPLPVTRMASNALIYAFRWIRMVMIYLAPMKVQLNTSFSCLPDAPFRAVLGT